MTGNQQSKDMMSVFAVEKQKIPVAALRLGMYVSELDRPWEETRFIFQGFLLLKDEDLLAVQKCCEYVYIEEAKSIPITMARSGKGASTDQSALTYISKSAPPASKQLKSRLSKFFSFSSKRRPKQVPLEKAVKPAFRSYTETKGLVLDVMQSVQLGKSIDTPAAKEAIEACVDNVMTNSEAMMLLTRLRKRDEYTSEHSLNVAITSIAFGRHIGMDRNQLRELGLCGLLHDMGKMLTPDEVLNKPGRLTDAEMDIMRKHPADGKEILLATHDVSDAAIETAYQHHERKNGQGYPNGHTLDELSLYTQMVAIVDTYDAITGERCYKPGMTAEAALRVIYNSSSDMFDSALAINFINNIGLYPLGAVVELHTGEIGVVIETNPTLRLRPKVRIVLDPNQVQTDERTVDLAKPDRDSHGEAYYIRTTHTPASLKVDLSEQIARFLQ
ncbi:MAG: HD-GYP domain-containing protein [bacterium]